MSVYTRGYSKESGKIERKSLREFILMGKKFLNHSILANKREDGLFHAYNLMTLKSEQEVSISYLAEMLEGQVAVLSSGYLSCEAALELMNTLRKSALYREDQNSYILYPDKNLPRFVEKNTVPQSLVVNSKLIKKLLEDGNSDILQKDLHGELHFNGNFNNAVNLRQALDNLPSQYENLVQSEGKILLDAFEAVFNHKAFTGRSGTFFGYEGLGSIYFHTDIPLPFTKRNRPYSSIYNRNWQRGLRCKQWLTDNFFD